MSSLRPKKLIRAEELIKAGNKEEALKIVLRFQQKAQFYLLGGEFDNALEVAMQCKELIEKIGKKIDIAHNFLLIGLIYFQKFNFKASLNFALQSLELQEKLDDRVGLASSLSLVGLSYWLNFDFDKAIKNCKQSLSIKEIVPRVKIENYRAMAYIHLVKGELTQALKYSENNVKLAEKGKFNDLYANSLYYLGCIYSFMSDFDKAEEYFKSSLELTEIYGSINPVFFDQLKGSCYFELIKLYIEIKYFKQAQEYLEYLKELADQKKDNFLSKAYSVTRGYMLIESGRTRDRAEAEILFKQVIGDDTFNIQDVAVYLYALDRLIYIYIEELGMSNDLEIIEDINPLVLRAFNLAEKLQSYLVMTEVKILQAKLELIKMNFDEAELLLTEAQGIAELHSIHYFAHRISNDHDRLLEQKEIWQRLKSTNAPISERIELASVNEILERIKGKRSEEPPELVDEQPVLLLIIAEGGLLIFSYPFTDEWKYDTEIFSSFLSAFTSFSDEFFSKGLDRVKFGDDTLLIQSADSFSIGYLYKGQTYPAKQKLTNFIKEIQNKSTIWQTLNKFYKTSQIAELKDIPLLESIIIEIFLSTAPELD